MFDTVAITLENRFKSAVWWGQDIIVFMLGAIALKYLGRAIGVDFFGILQGQSNYEVGRNVRQRPTKASVLGSGRTDLGSNENHWHDDAKELMLNMPMRKINKDNEHYVNTRALNNNLSVSDKHDTLYKSPNAYEPEISENDIATKLLGRPQ